jgi:hypothetical protein
MLLWHLENLTFLESNLWQIKNSDSWESVHSKEGESYQTSWGGSKVKTKMKMKIQIQINTFVKHCQIKTEDFFNWSSFNVSFGFTFVVKNFHFNSEIIFSDKFIFFSFFFQTVFCAANRRSDNLYQSSRFRDFRFKFKKSSTAINIRRLILF